MTDNQGGPAGTDAPPVGMGRTDDPLADVTPAQSGAAQAPVALVGRDPRGLAGDKDVPTPA